MFNASIATNGILVCTRMEKSEVKGFFIISAILRKQNLLVHILRIVIIGMIATDSSNIDAGIFIIPLVYRKKYELFINRPGIGNSIHEAVIYNIPEFGVVLLFLFQNLENYSAAFTNRIFTEFRINVGFIYPFIHAGFLDILYYFLNNVFVIIFKAQVIPDRQSAAKVK